jgi:quercetin dioxygenase-like cupin family protein
VTATFMGADELAWVEFAPGKQRRVLLHTPELMQVEARIAAGVVTAPHSHPHVQVSRVLSGRLRVMVGDETSELDAGGSFIVPSGVTHGATALTDVVLLDTFTPARTDFVVS